MIPHNVVRMAQINAQRSQSTIYIYRHNETFVVVPAGYTVQHPNSLLLGYVTASGELIESDQSHETTKERRVEGD